MGRTSVQSFVLLNRVRILRDQDEVCCSKSGLDLFLQRFAMYVPNWGHVRCPIPIGKKKKLQPMKLVPSGSQDPLLLNSSPHGCPSVSSFRSVFLSLQPFVSIHSWMRAPPLTLLGSREIIWWYLTPLVGWNRSRAKYNGFRYYCPLLSTTWTDSHFFTTCTLICIRVRRTRNTVKWVGFEGAVTRIIV